MILFIIIELFILVLKYMSNKFQGKSVKCYHTTAVLATHFNLTASSSIRLYNILLISISGRLAFWAVFIFKNLLSCKYNYNIILYNIYVYNIIFNILTCFIVSVNREHHWIVNCSISQKSMSCAKPEKYKNMKLSKIVVIYLLNKKMLVWFK